LAYGYGCTWLLGLPLRVICELRRCRKYRNIEKCSSKWFKELSVHPKQNSANVKEIAIRTVTAKTVFNASNDEATNPSPDVMPTKELIMLRRKESTFVTIPTMH
jgi:hypothetical protein